VLGDEHGLPGDAVEGLVRDGYLVASHTGGRRVPGMRHGADPWLFAVLTGTLLAQAPPQELPAMRRWPLARWRKEVDALLDQRLRKQLAKGWLREWLDRAKSGVGHLVQQPGRPSGLTEVEYENWHATRSRVGEYVKRIGNTARSELQQLVEQARREGLTPPQLMLRLSTRMRGYERDWLAVARTELQAAHNEAAAAAAAERDGPTARVARVPEHDACEHCKALYLDASGRPIIWRLDDLLANGTNFGRKSATWQATLYPLHTNCRCGTVRVPPGYGFDASWQLVTA
jgi:hypothetical protein